MAPKVLFSTKQLASLNKQPVSIESSRVGKGDITTESVIENTVTSDRDVPLKILFNPDKTTMKSLVVKRIQKDVNNEKPELGSVKQITFKSTEDASKNKKLSTPVTDDLASKLSGVPVPETPISQVTAATPVTEKNETSFVKVPKALNDDIDFLDNGYYISPSMETLKSLDLMQLRHVDNLIIGEPNFGKIEFLNSVDLSNVSLNMLCGSIVTIGSKMCEVYRNSTNIPPPSEGINVRCRITLYHCFPVDKSTRKPITDPEHPAFVRMIEKLKKDNDSNRHFESFDPLTGTFTFITENCASQAPKLS